MTIGCPGVSTSPHRAVVQSRRTFLVVCHELHRLGFRGSEIVATEFIGGIDSHQLHQFLARAIDAALDRSDRATADGSRFLIGNARRGDEQERLALVRGRAP